MKRRKTGFAAVFLVLLAGLAAQKALARYPTDEGAQQQPPASVQFHLGGNAAEIPARFIDHLVFLPAGVDRSQPSLFQLDSTAATSCIDPQRAKELDIADLDSPVLNMSGVDVTLASLSESAQKDFAANVGRAYEGTLGNDFFNGAVIEINYARQTVRLYDPAYQYPGHEKAIHLSFIAGLPVIRAKISVTGGKAVEGDFVLDTALDASVVISQKFAESHKLRPHKTTPSTEFAVAEGDPAMLARVAEFEVGSRAVPQSIGVFARGNPVLDRDGRLAGEIGGGMLRHFIVTIDYPHQQVVFEPGGEFRSDEFEDMSGLAIVASGPGLKRFEVTQVWPHTPGAEAKIRKGDSIEGVNDEAAADMSLSEIRALFRQPGAKYKVLLQRDNQTVTVNLQMRRLLEPTR
jgi:hypothetical protein